MMKTLFLTSVALGLLAGTATFADVTGTKLVEREYALVPGQAREMLPEGYGIGAFQCPIVAAENGNWFVTPPVAKELRAAVQTARRGSTFFEREVEVNVGTEKRPEIETITVRGWDQDANERSTGSVVIGDVLFVYNQLAGRCDLWTYNEIRP